MLKTIEQLKVGRKVLEDIQQQTQLVKTEQCTSYPTGLPNSVLDLSSEIKYNKMIVALLEYWMEEVGSEEIKLGKYIRMYLRVLQTRLELDFCLDLELCSRLYDEVFGSHSTIYLWVEKHFPSVFGMILGYSLDDNLIQFNNLGTQTRNNGERHLCWNDSEFNEDCKRGKRMIKALVELSKNAELMNDLDEVLKVYFDKLFKNNKEEDWY